MRARGLRFHRPHRKILLWWNSWLAIQFVSNEWFSLGIHVEPLRPLVDVFLGPVTIAVGKHPILTDPRYAQRHCGRGFLVPISPAAPAASTTPIVPAEEPPL